MYHSCAHNHPVNAEPIDPAILKEVNRIAKAIWDGTAEGDLDPKLTDLVAEKLRDALIEGWGKDLPAIDYTKPDFDKLGNLEKNVYQFSAAKNYQHLKTLTLAVKDGNRIRTFTEFRNEVLKISDVYVGSWLRTEYNTSIAGAQMAAKWTRFTEDKEALPLLEYRTVGDERVRPTHEAIDKVIKHIDDPFWDLYFPPNGWGCRCDVIQAVDGEETPDDQIIPPDDVPKMFRVNLGKEGLAFPATHPYYKGIPKAIIKQGEDLLTERIFNWAKKMVSGKRVTAAEIGEVQFTEAGIRNILTKTTTANMEKNQVVYAIKDLMAHAPFDKTVIKEGLKHHYYKFKLKGKDAWILVKEDAKGNKIVSQIVDKIP